MPQVTRKRKKRKGVQIEKKKEKKDFFGFDE